MKSGNGKKQLTLRREANLIKGYKLDVEQRVKYIQNGIRYLNCMLLEYNIFGMS